LHDEANVSAQQSPPKEDSRISRPHVELRGPPGAQAPSSEGPQAPDGLSGSRDRSFPPGLRLRKRREFLVVYEQGIRVPGDRLVLFVHPHASGPPRIGLTATRKVGCSVVRNRIRRQVREAFRKNRPSLGAWDVVVNIRQRAVGCETRVIEAEFLALAGRAQRTLRRREQEAGR
jgi:ribonuclease P protein component